MRGTERTRLDGIGAERMGMNFVGARRRVWGEAVVGGVGFDFLQYFD